MNKLKAFMRKLIKAIEGLILITDEELDEYFESIEDDQYWIN